MVELNNLVLRIEALRKEVGEEMEKHMNEEHVPDDRLMELSRRLDILIAEYIRGFLNRSSE